MAKIQLSVGDYFDKAYACWLGKSIGGTLGGPWEGRKEVLHLNFYDPVPEEAMFNDDLDLQLVWLHALQTKGININAHDLAREWIDHITYPFCEYGYNKVNTLKGLRPPLTGSFNNWFIDGMGAPIRSEIWALIAPAAPAVAAAYAYEDAIVDHAENSVWGEMLLAAIESAAFVESDPHKLIEIGLSMIPEDCRLAGAVRDTIDWHGQGLDWLETRERIVERYGHYDMTNSPQNHGFITLGWLYGEDYGDALCKAVNCGYDTDCTGATLGSILAIIGGTRGIPEKWKAPIADKVVVGWGVVDFEYETSLDSLTEATLKVARKVVATKCDDVELVEDGATDLSAAREMDWVQADEARAIADRDPFTDVRDIGDWQVSIDYQGLPTITYARPKTVRLRLTNRSEGTRTGTVSVEAPPEWSATGGGGFHVQPNATEQLDITFSVDEEKVRLPVSEMINVRVITGAEAIVLPFALVGEPIWFYSKVFPNEDGAGHEAVYPPEEQIPDDGRISDPGATGYTRTTFPENELDVAQCFEGDEPATVYLYTSIHCPEERLSKIEAISNAGIKLWFNGKQIMDYHDHEDRPPYQHGGVGECRVEDTLREGWNHFLLKFTRCRPGEYVHFFIVKPTDQQSNGYADLNNASLPE